VLIYILWNIWKCGNAKLFRHEDEANLHIARQCQEPKMISSSGLAFLDNGLQNPASTSKKYRPKLVQGYSKPKWKQDP
jgi:hypothetical protein